MDPRRIQLLALDARYSIEMLIRDGELRPDHLTELRCAHRALGEIRETAYRKQEQASAAVRAVACDNVPPDTAA